MLGTNEARDEKMLSKNIDLRMMAVKKQFSKSCLLRLPNVTDEERRAGTHCGRGKADCLENSQVWEYRGHSWMTEQWT